MTRRKLCVLTKYFCSLEISRLRSGHVYHVATYLWPECADELISRSYWVVVYKCMLPSNLADTQDLSARYEWLHLLFKDSVIDTNRLHIFAQAICVRLEDATVLNGELLDYLEAVYGLVCYHTTVVFPNAKRLRHACATACQRQLCSGTLEKSETFSVLIQALCLVW